MNRRKTHTIDFLFVITLFFLFALSSLAMIGVGAKVYENSVQTLSDNSDSRTASLYLTEKVRQHDAKDAVSLGQFQGQTSLVLAREVDGESYLTYIYLYDGYLMELEVRNGNEESVEASSGQRIIEAEDFQLTLENHLLAVSIQHANGEDESFHIKLNAA